MKYTWIYLAIFMAMSCSQKNISNQSNPDNLKSLLQAGKNITIENKVFKDEVDFTKLIQSEEISSGIFQGKTMSLITFKNCVFKKDIIAYRKTDEYKIQITNFSNSLSFLECRFEGEVNFRGSSVMGKVDFSKSIFVKRVNFEEAIFFQNANFSECKFEAKTKFQNSLFHQNAIFFGAEFKQLVSFQNSIFKIGTQFSNAQFEEYADFSLLDCRGKVFFNYSKFFKKADFSNSIFAQDFNLINTENQYTDFRGCRFMGKTLFFKSSVKDILNLTNCFFLFGTPSFDFLSKEKVIMS